jgi:hypothetical protein
MTTIVTRLTFAFAENLWDLSVRRKGAQKNPPPTQQDDEPM